MTQVSPHGLHHVTAIATDPQSNVDFYTKALEPLGYKAVIDMDGFVAFGPEGAVGDAEEAGAGGVVGLVLHLRLQPHVGGQHHRDPRVGYAAQHLWLWAEES